MSSVSGVESARLVVDGLGSIVSEAIKGEEVVRYPVCEWWEEIEGLTGGLENAVG